jgi:hypothetical protein
LVNVLWTLATLAKAEVIEVHEFIIQSWTFYHKIQNQFITMRVYSRLLATATDAGAAKGPFRPAPAALLPPIPLYRTILRTHRKKLPVEQRVLGDMYVKAEFRAHKAIDNPVQIVGSQLCT